MEQGFVARCVPKQRNQEVFDGRASMMTTSTEVVMPTQFDSQLSTLENAMFHNGIPDNDAQLTLIERFSVSNGVHIYQDWSGNLDILKERQLSSVDNTTMLVKWLAGLPYCALGTVFSGEILAIHISTAE